MKHVILLGVVLTSTGLLTACANEPTQTAIATGMPSTDPNNDMVDMGQTPGVVTPNETLPVDDTFEPTVQQTLDYMRYLGPSLIGRVLIWIAAALTLITGYDYLIVGLKHMAADDRRDAA